MEERVGDFLVRIGAMTQDQVVQVVKAQEKEPRPRLFGQIAVEMGFVDEAAVQRYLWKRE